MEFKVGDKLYARKSGGNHTEGRTYEVLGIEHDNFVYIHITGDRENARIREEVMPRFFGRVSEVPQVAKVKLTQEQVVALEELKRSVYRNSELIFKHATQEYSVGLRSLGALSVEKFATALLIGYETERTAEEKVLEVWLSHDWNVPRHEKEHHDAYYSGFRKGMKFVLDAYGIKVKGIND